MRKTRQREKMLNALIFFSQNIEKVGKTKLFKLLYYLDFLHYEKTGKSVTGLDYYAWERGPVPHDLYNEIKHPTPEFTSHIRKRKRTYPNGKTSEVLEGTRKFEDKWFSDFELELMEKLAKQHFRHTAQEMSDKSHFETGPWDEIYNVRGRPSEKIPYSLILERRGNERDLELLELAKEYEELRANYG